jgi:cbb3-type cytochrome c oxidase subunit II
MAKDKKWLPLYRPYPQEWAPHPVKKMLMTPMLVILGGLFAFAIPTFIAAFVQIFYFQPPVSDEWAPLTAKAERGREIFVANGCMYCHSGFVRPQDVEVGLYYLYPRVAKPGDYATSDSSPNIFGTARIGPDLSQESGFHPDDWELAHLNNARYVTPDSIMPEFSFLSDSEAEDLNAFLQTRSGKSGLVRYAGQLYMKKLLLVGGNLPDPPSGFQAEQMTLADVADAAVNAPDPPAGDYDGLGWPDPINLNIVDRTYWLAGNPLPVTNDNLLRGREIFQERCIGCHGEGGAAVSEAARYMSPMPIDFTSPDDASGGADTSPGDYYYRILRGIPGSAMENFGTRLRVDDIWKVTLFLKTIPNGGLQQLPTPEMYIQWQPPDDLMAYVDKHPIDANKQFEEPGPPDDPFVLEARRVLAGLNDADSFMLPGYGEVSIEAAARDIKTIYEGLLDEGWSDYLDRGGDPVPSADQKDALPELGQELR